MSKTDDKPEKQGELDEYGGRPSSGQWHKGTAVKRSEERQASRAMMQRRAATQWNLPPSFGC